MDGQVLPVHRRILAEIMMVLLESINLVDQVLILLHEVLLSVRKLSLGLAKESTSADLDG